MRTIEHLLNSRIPEGMATKAINQTYQEFRLARPGHLGFALFFRSKKVKKKKKERPRA